MSTRKQKDVFPTVGTEQDNEREEVQRMLAAAEQMPDTAAQSLHRSADQFHENSADAAHRLHGAAEDIRHHMSSGGSEQGSLQEDLAGLVKEYPLPAFALAFGAGFMLGQQMRPRRRQRVQYVQHEQRRYPIT